MRKLMMVVFFALFALPALPQEPTKERTAVYQVTDMLAEKNVALQLWTYRTVPDFDRYGKQRPFTADQIRKEVFGQKQSANVETRRLWWSEFRTMSEETYFREELIPTVFNLGTEQRVFGHMEQRRVSDNSVVMSWPIFTSIRKPENGLYTITESSFMPQGVTAVTVKVCKDSDDDGCIFPVQQGEALYDSGKLVRFMMYTWKR